MIERLPGQGADKRLDLLLEEFYLPAAQTPLLGAVDGWAMNDIHRRVQDDVLLAMSSHMVSGFARHRPEESFDGIRQYQ